MTSDFWVGSQYCQNRTPCIRIGSLYQDKIRQGQVRDDSTNGYDTRGQNFYLKFHYEFQKMTLILFVCLQKICNFAKLGGCGSKIKPATPISILNFNGAWQAQFLNHTHVTLENYVFFIDLQMMLPAFFGIPNRKSVI